MKNRREEVNVNHLWGHQKNKTFLFRSGFNLSKFLFLLFFGGVVVLIQAGPAKAGPSTESSGLTLNKTASVIELDPNDGLSSIAAGELNKVAKQLDNSVYKSLVQAKRELLGRNPKAVEKLYGKLPELIDVQTRFGSAEAIIYAESQKIPVVDETVTVIAVPKAGILPSQLANILTNKGCAIIRIGHDHIKALVPLSVMDSLAKETEELDYIYLPIKAHSVNSVISEGVGNDSWTNAQNWQDHDLKGAGIKVAVIDSGFEGLADRISEDEIPSSAITYDTTGTGMETDGYHGCAVAEVIYDMAPNAQLYLIKIADSSDLEDAVDYCISNSIDIINFSAGWHIFNFFDGVAYSSMVPSPVTIANYAQTNGILWVNAAGNYREGHALTSWTDADANGVMEWAPGNEINTLVGTVAYGEAINLVLTWNRWPTTDQDFDMELYRFQAPSGNWILVDQSTYWQTGTQPPLEIISYVAGSTSLYGVKIVKYSATSSPTFILRSSYSNLNYYGYNNNSSPVGGSIFCPADAASVLTVGAIDEDYYRIGPIESFSSIGPTNGSYTGQPVITKPDLCGPDDTISVTYSGGFLGTSASAPHIAGAAALVWSRFPGYTNSQVRSYLEGATIDLGSGGKDNIYGYGPLVLNKVWNLTTSSTTGGYIAIPGEGTYLYDDGTVVDVNAVADAGWAFDSWSGDLTGSDNPDSITMDGNKDVNAIFIIEDQYTLTVNITGNGSVTKTPDQATYSYGTVVDVNAVADAGWTFDSWSGDLTGSDNPDSITMDGNKDVNAIFTEDQYTLTINVVGNGSVTKSPDQATYTYGTVVDVNAVADAGWTFDSWSGDLTGSDNPDSITMDANKTITAIFVQQYTITASADSNGTIDPCGIFPVSSGQDQLFIATPNTDYDVNTWYLDSNSIQVGGSTYLLTNIQANHTVYVNFKPIPDIYVSSSHDYGSVALGVYTEWSCYIYNFGEADLIITDINGLSDTDFSLINPPETPFTIEPSSYERIVIRFEPSSLGEITATLSIVNNDPDESLKEVDLIGTGVEPQIIFVDVNATGNNDGASWADAFNHLQDALTAANNGDTIWIAEGIYKPDQGEGVTPGDPNFSFELINTVSIYGGFPFVGDPNFNDRNPDTYETILSADLNGDDNPLTDPCDLLTDPNRAENSFHVITGNGTTTVSVLDGLTITGGNADSSYPDYYGGGLYYYSGTISNCKITRNSANNYGGGLYNCDGIINDCNISNNTASYGGGLSGCDGTINNCIITRNLATNYGGGLFSGSSKLTSCIITSNATDGHGGGLYLSSGDITACTIADNYATDYGAGIRSCYGLIDNCIIWGNVTESGGDQISSSSDPNYSCIQDWTTGGVGNISDNPYFIEPGYWDSNGTPGDVNDDFWVNGDYHLSPSSPCIDTGDPNYAAEANELDIDGDARVIAGRIDMGADEYTFGELSDFSGNGIVNFEDFSILAYYWKDYVCEEPDWCEGCDYNQNGEVDVIDLKRFTENWLWQASWYNE